MFIQKKADFIVGRKHPISWYKRTRLIRNCHNPPSPIWCCIFLHHFFKNVPPNILPRDGIPNSLLRNISILDVSSHCSLTNRSIGEQTWADYYVLSNYCIIISFVIHSINNHELHCLFVFMRHTQHTVIQRHHGERNITSKFADACGRDNNQQGLHIRCSSQSKNF